MPLPPRDQISALLKQMTMFSSPCLPYLSVLFSLCWSYRQREQLNMTLTAVLLYASQILLKTTAVKDLADSTHFY